MIPWSGTEALTTALGDESCGCSLEERASEEVDPEAARVYREAAVEAQKKWGCPVGCHKPLDTLSTEQKAALKAVENLTKADCSGCTTCPRADLYLYHNGAPNQIGLDTEQVIKARHWRDKGQLQLVNPQPTNTLVEAIDALDIAFNLYQKYLKKQAEERSKREQQRLDEANNPNVRERVQG